MRTRRRGSSHSDATGHAALLILALVAAACGPSARPAPAAITTVPATTPADPASPERSPPCDPTNLTECRDRCGKGDEESCFSLAKLLQRGSRIGGTEENEYAPILQRTCDGKSAHTAEACGRLAYVLWMSPNLKNPLRARELGQKACDLGGSLGCIFLAREDKQSSWPVRAERFERACKLGDPDGCGEAATLLVEGREGLPRDTARGLELLERACTGGDAAACAHLFFLHERGTVKSGRPTDVAPDPGKRDAYLKKYCALGATGHGVQCAP